jgi:hypothetical protein
MPTNAAVADARVTAAVLDRVLVRYPDLPRTVADPRACLTGADLGGRLRRRGGRLVPEFGQYAGHPVDEGTGDDPGDLRWLLGQDFLPDFKPLVARARDAAGDGPFRSPGWRRVRRPNSVVLCGHAGGLSTPVHPEVGLGSTRCRRRPGQVVARHPMAGIVGPPQVELASPAPPFPSSAIPIIAGRTSPDRRRCRVVRCGPG